MTDIEFAPLREGQRQTCAEAVGVPDALLALLIAGASHPRYGRPGRFVADPYMVQDRSEKQGVSIGMLQQGQRLARALDLDDPYIGEDVVYVEQIFRNDPEGPYAAFVPTLMPHAFIKTAIRTGLYLPDRSNVNMTGERDSWYAFASGWQRVDQSSTTWLAIAEIAYWRHRYERAADGKTPTAAWQVEGDQMLMSVAEALCAKKALGCLLDSIPCLALGMPIDDDIDFQTKRAEAFRQEAEILENIRKSGGEFISRD